MYIRTVRLIFLYFSLIMHKTIYVIIVNFDKMLNIQWWEWKYEQ